VNELKVVARLLAQERGEAVRLTRQRPYPLSDYPMVLVPIAMAGASPALFALGLGDGVAPCQVYVCCEPRNRAQQYDMLGRTAQAMEAFLHSWASNSALMPQLITPSRDASHLGLVTIHRLTYAPQPALRGVGRQLHWLDRVFERSDSAALLCMPSALCELFATGQDEHADTHLGAVLEWLKPADGQIYERVLRAENDPSSTSTHPRLDNEKLVPRVDALGRVEKTANSTDAHRLRTEIAEILCDEVNRRYALIIEAVSACRRFPASAAADHVQQQDRARHDRNLAYVANPNNLVAARLSGTSATGEFLARELNAEHMEQLMVRSVSNSRSGARLSGNILVGKVMRRNAQKSGRKTAIHFQIRSKQERLALRRGDKLTRLDDAAFEFTVLDCALDASGATTVTLALTGGSTKSGQPELGDYVELAEPLSSPERIARTMRLARDRLRMKRPQPPVTSPFAVKHDYLSGVRNLRGIG
jgi:hypothetical protein